MTKKGKSALIYDYGSSLGLAMRMSRDGYDVFYFAPWEGSFPKTDKYYIGEGFKEITAVESFWEYVDKVDFVFFPDIYTGDLQEYLRGNGYNVAGSHKAEKIEINRLYFYETLKKLGQPFSPYKVVRGLDALREHLRTVKDKYVKFPYFRGNFESLHHISYEHTAPILDHVSQQMGLSRDMEDFIVQDPIPNAVEIGFDGMFCDGKFPSRYPIVGLEVKDKCYVAKVMGEYPRLIRRNNDAFAPLLKSLGLRGLYSTELRVTSPQTAYFIDPCVRMAMPAGNCVSELYGNYSEIIEGLSNGELVEPRPVAGYAAELVLSSDSLADDWLAVDVPSKYSQWVKLKNACRIKNQAYCIPMDDMGTVGSAVGIGDTLDEAIEKAKEAADSVASIDASFHFDAFGEAKSELRKLMEITKGEIDLL